MLTGHQDGSITHWRVEAMSAQALRVLSLSVYPVHRILKLRYSLLVITSQQLYHLDSKTLSVCQQRQWQPLCTTSGPPKSQALTSG